MLLTAYDKRSTVFTSQFSTDLWYENLADPTLADAILDRILHNAYKLELTGESLRKAKRNLMGKRVRAYNFGVLLRECFSSCFSGWVSREIRA